MFKQVHHSPSYPCFSYERLEAKTCSNGFTILPLTPASSLCIEFLLHSTLPSTPAIKSSPPPLPTKLPLALPFSVRRRPVYTQSHYRLDLARSGCTLSHPLPPYPPSTHLTHISTNEPESLARVQAAFLSSSILARRLRKMRAAIPFMLRDTPSARFHFLPLPHVEGGGAT